MHARRFVLGFLALALGFASGCETTAPRPETVSSNPRPEASLAAAQLRAGDTLKVSLQGIPDASDHVVQIDERGAIHLPYLGALPAAGLTAAELSAAVRRDYVEKNFYRAIDVSVAVTERYVYVGGEVVRPGRIVWTPDLTVTKAVQAAGGFTLYAREAKVSLTRERRTYDIDARLAQRKPQEDPGLLPGDALQVPRSPF